MRTACKEPVRLKRFINGVGSFFDLMAAFIRIARIVQRPEYSAQIVKGADVNPRYIGFTHTDHA